LTITSFTGATYRTALQHRQIAQARFRAIAFQRLKLTIATVITPYLLIR
jgi:hypothetical protein